MATKGKRITAAYIKRLEKLYENEPTKQNKLNLNAAKGMYYSQHEDRRK